MTESKCEHIAFRNCGIVTIVYCSFKSECVSSWQNVQWETLVAVGKKKNRRGFESFAGSYFYWLDFINLTELKKCKKQSKFCRCVVRITQKVSVVTAGVIHCKKLNNC